ncbi:MAG: ankyrin repeat domain-containing protein [Gemmatimonadota bacterium]
MSVGTLDLPADDPLAVAVVAAIRGGDLETLGRLLGENPDLATARVGDPRDCAGEERRTLVHVATDWPGHFPNGATTVAMLTAAGADVDARFRGPHAETALHWAASSDDVAVLDALLDAGADIETPGAVNGGGTPLADAVAFGQWRAAWRLIERGARTTLWQAAALGLMARVEEHLATDAPLEGDAITNAFWCACHGGQRDTAERLLGLGADIDWVGYNGLTPLDAANRTGAPDLVAWLRSRGARSAHDLA